jgi:hypothetical protein
MHKRNTEPISQSRRNKDASRQMDSRSDPEVTRSNTRPMDILKYSNSQRGDRNTSYSQEGNNLMGN